jgi:hypothetical protein
VSFGVRENVGTVRGFVWNDSNGDGLQSPGEAPLADVPVFIDSNGDGIPAADEPATISAADGSWVFPKVPTGLRSIAQIVPAGWITAVGKPRTVNLSVAVAGTSTVAFFDLFPTTGTVSGIVFDDVNADGLRDPGERGLSGITVFLDTNTNGLLDPGEPSTVTQVDYFFTPAIDETGNYSFTHLGRGNYSVREIVPPSQNATPPDARVRTVQLPALAAATADFPNRFRASEIHGVVFHDTDADDILDGSEYRRPDVPVFLDLDRDDFCDPDEPQTTSGPDGSYSFGSLPPGACVVREKVRQPGDISVPPTGGGVLWPRGTSRSASGNVAPTSLQLTLANGQSSLQNVSLTLPGTGSLSTLVDVFLLFDDTGSFTANSPIVRAAFPTIISTLQTSLPGIDLAFGVGRFEEYGGFAAEFPTGRPFILNQPIVEAARPGFSTAIQAALDRTTRGYRGDAPETDIEALYQLVTGLGFDGNNNGTTLESGPSGPATTQLNPGDSGDVPAFSSFQPDPTTSVLAPSGTIGGAGFRPGALPVILTATDTGFAYQPKGEVQVTGLNGVSLPLASLTQLSRGTTPSNLFAGLQETVTGLNALGALVIGLGTNPLATQDPRQALESLAKLTGAVNRSLISISIPNGTPDPIDPGDPFYFQIVSGFVTTVADGVTSAIQNAVTNVAMDITIRASDPRVQIINHTGTLTGIAAGQTAAFEIEFIGDGRPARFDLQFIRSGTSVVLGSIPVVSGTPIPGDGYNFDDLEDGEIHNSSHFGHVVANQAPMFLAGPSQSALEDAGTQSVPGWATGIAPGAPTETQQTLQFTVTTSNPVLFSVAPFVSPDGTLSWQSAPNDFGTLSFSYVINDGFADSAPVTVTIDLAAVNDAPVAQADRYITAEDTTVNATTVATSLLANDLDPDGDSLTVLRVLDPLHGTLTLSTNGQFTYRASDGLLTSAVTTVTLNVLPVNDPPVANDDSYTTSFNTPITVAAPGLQLNDRDVDGDPLTAVLATSPAHGSLSFNPDGSFTWTPAVGYSGSDSFQYQTSDGTTLSAAATVTITVTPPVLTPKFFVVDATGLRNFQYTADGSSITSTALATRDSRPRGIATNPTGTIFWVTDDTLATHRVFRYSLTGILEGTWTLSPAGPTPTGITLDPNNVHHLWVVDSTTDRVYQYDAGTTFTTGTPAPSLSFPLAAGNGNATGIADPGALFEAPVAAPPSAAAGDTASNEQTVGTATPRQSIPSVFAANFTAATSGASISTSRSLLRRLQTALHQKSLSARRLRPESPLHRLPQPAPIDPRDLDELFSSQLGLLDSSVSHKIGGQNSMF